jgi:hypothetical protein
MIESLKKNIEVKLGREIRRRGDCQYLSDRIHEELDETLSYNTIRRAFGVESDCHIKPRISTLNILSQFIGYKTYKDFYKESDWSQEWSLQIRISGWVDRMDEQEIIGSLTSAWFKNDNFSISFVSIIRELFLLGNIQLINKIFKNSAFEFDRLTYSEVLYIGNGVGSVLRKIKMTNEDLAILLKNERFVQHIFLSFVDYSSLVGYYGSLPEIAEEYSVILKSDQKLFFKAILNLKNLLSNNEIESIDYQSLKKESLHPIAIGRLASMEIAARIQKGVSYDDVLRDISERIQSSESNKMIYLYELKTVSLILRDFYLMEWICSVDNLSIEEEYQVSHEQYLYIVRFISAIKSKDESGISDAIMKISKRKWVLSYYSFFNVYTFIGTYHATSNFNKRKKILREYNSLSKELKYSLFNDSYLTKYFDE